MSKEIIITFKMPEKKFKDKIKHGSKEYVSIDEANQHINEIYSAVSKSKVYSSFYDAFKKLSQTTIDKIRRMIKKDDIVFIDKQSGFYSKTLKKIDNNVVIQKIIK